MGGGPFGNQVSSSLEGLTLSPGRLTCVLRVWQGGFSPIPGALRREMWAGRCPGTVETCRWETGDFVQILPHAAGAQFLPLPA